MMRRMVAAAALSVVIVGGTVACSSSDYSKADFQEDLETEAGMTPEAAACAADGLDGQVDLAKAADAESESDLSEEELALVTEVLSACIAESMGLDPADLDPGAVDPDASTETDPGAEGETTEETEEEGSGSPG